MNLTQEQLADILDKHRKWLFSEEGGMRADLWRANLTGANLRGANLTDADLRGADLWRAVLTGANLRGAVLRGANLWRAVLTGANLRGAVLRGANLTGANLTDADLTDANLRGADLWRANLTGANLRGADLTVTVPIIPNIDSAILKAVNAEGCALNMSEWHTCETTHCRAGWAITLAGPVGKTLEEIWGASVAGALIYNASRPGKRIPDFHASNEDAMNDIMKCAAEEGRA